MRLVQNYVCMLMIASCCLIGFTESSEKTERLSPICPTGCRCITTTEGLHKAVCSNLQPLYKYTHANKHHNVNIIDLSYSNITKVNDELDSFTEIVTLDLSYNNIKTLNKFLANSKKLVHLNLNNNELKTFSASTIPSSVSSLDLRYNSLRNVPSELSLLPDLEHLQLEGNPLHCNCANIKILNGLKLNKVVLDQVTCKTPQKWKNVIWSDIKLNQLCPHPGNKDIKSNDDAMFADEPENDMSTVNDLSTGEIFEAKNPDADEDENEYLRVSTDKPNNSADEIHEGSGFIGISNRNLNHVENITDEYEGSGYEGSGLFLRFQEPSSSTSEPDEINYHDEDDIEGSGYDSEEIPTSSTTETQFITGLLDLAKLDFEPHDNLTIYGNELPARPNIFGENVDWDSDIDENVSEKVFEGRKISPNENTPSTVVESDPIEPIEPVEPIETKSERTVTAGITNTDDTENERLSESKKDKPPTSPATYIVVGIIVVILIGLIAITLIKSRLRKRRDQRQTRTEKPDIEKAGKEMVDMNKALLGKPALATNEIEKKMNGNYEMVPTHEPLKKLENGNTEKAPNHMETELQNSPPSQNGYSLNPDDDNYLSPPVSLTPLRLTPEHNHNGYSDRDSYPEDYTPASPVDSGRVKIKLSETQKPKTPVLVNRSRSNAGDIIITPVVNQSTFKPTT